MAGENVLVYFEQGGARLRAKSGGSIIMESGATLEVAGVTIDASTLALNGLTASATELNEQVLTLDIADGSAEASYYLVSPHAGTITKIQSVIDAAVSTADITITASIGGVDVTDGVLTIATAASGAGDVDSCSPSAANVLTAGQAIKFLVTGGGAGGAPRIHLSVTITR